MELVRVATVANVTMLLELQSTVHVNIEGAILSDEGRALYMGFVQTLRFMCERYASDFPCPRCRWFHLLLMHVTQRFEAQCSAFRPAQVCRAEWASI